MKEKIVFFVMGVSGCGKSSVSELFSRLKTIKYVDADDLHPDSNVKKMRNGIPLNDSDRLPWLQALNRMATEYYDKDCGIVVACSCLKPEYRQILHRGIEEKVMFIYLKGSFSVIEQRMKERGGHYFKGEDMLKSQFDALIEPTPNEPINYIEVCIDNDDIEGVTALVMEKLYEVKNG